MHWGIAAIMTHLASTLPDRIEIGALRSEEWRTDINRTDGGVERRESRWEAPLRSYDVSLPITKRDDADYLAAKALYAAAKGSLHSFSFKDWTDNITIPVRFDGPLQLTGLMPDDADISFVGFDKLTFTLVEVKDPEAL